MKTHTILRVLCLAASLPLLLPAHAGGASQGAAAAAQSDKNMVIYLGNVKVTGEKKIVEALQAIKIGLQLPYSSDPRMANVVVCRLVPVAGSHIKKWLICGTNRKLAAQRDAMHLAMSMAISENVNSLTQCISNRCYNAVFSAIKSVLGGQRGEILHQQVNGTAVENLLRNIPYPAWWSTSASTPTTAPAATTHHY